MSIPSIDFLCERPITNETFTYEKRMTSDDKREFSCDLESCNCEQPLIHFHLHIPRLSKVGFRVRRHDNSIRIQQRIHLNTIRMNRARNRGNLDNFEYNHFSLLTLQNSFQFQLRISSQSKHLFGKTDMRLLTLNLISIAEAFWTFRLSSFPLQHLITYSFYF